MSRTTTKLPRVLPVCGTEWEVLTDSFDPEDADTVGKTEPLHQTVTLYEAAIAKAPKQGPVQKVLLHECVHISLIEAGLDELLGDQLDEAVCKAVEKGLWPLIQDGIFNVKGGKQ